MSWTKRQIVLQAFNEIGLANYEFDLAPGMLQTALYTLDAGMGELLAAGVFLPYPLAETQEDSSLDQSSNLPAVLNKPIYQMLACAIAPSFGKTPSPITIAGASNGRSIIFAQYGQPPVRRYPSTTPAGAGNKPWRSQGQMFLNPRAYPNSPINPGAYSFWDVQQ
jgi:hypothetical protein